ncbi:hypothetical protein D3C75_1110310 [compost metagenome]
MRVRNANCRMLAVLPPFFGGISSMFSQYSVSRSAGSVAPVKRMRVVCCFFGSRRNTGGATANGALALSGVDWSSPSSSHTWTSTARSPSFMNLSVTSLSCAG